MAVFENEQLKYVILWGPWFVEQGTLCLRRGARVLPTIEA